MLYFCSKDKFPTQKQIQVDSGGIRIGGGMQMILLRMY